MPNAVLLVDGEKPCPTCKKTLPASSFSKSSKTASGLRSLCKKCIKAKSALYYTKNKVKLKAGQKARIAKLKAQVLTHYGNGKLACVTCGYSNLIALSIDHINGGGGKHRATIHRNFYQWLIDNKYPQGYQTLCMNCQYIKREVSGEQLRIYAS